MPKNDTQQILSLILDKLEEQGKKIENIENRITKLDTFVKYNMKHKRNTLDTGDSSNLDTDLTTIQWAIIKELEQMQEWVSIYELSERLGKSRHYINAYINELENRGLIKRRPNLDTLKPKKKAQAPTPRYLYRIDEIGEKLLIKLFPECTKAT